MFDTQYTGAQLLLIRRIMSFKILRQYLNLKDTRVFYFKREIRNQIPECCTRMPMNKVARGLTTFQAEGVSLPPLTPCSEWQNCQSGALLTTGLVRNEKHIWHLALQVNEFFQSHGLWNKRLSDVTFERLMLHCICKETVFETSQIRVWIGHVGIESPHWLSICFPITILNPSYLCTVIFGATTFAFIVLQLRQFAVTGSLSREQENKPLVILLELTNLFVNIKSNQKEFFSNVISAAKSQLYSNGFIDIPHTLLSRLKTSFSLPGEVRVNTERTLTDETVSLSYLPDYWGDSLFEAHLVHVTLQSSTLRS